jgi:hypothetical protein
MKIMIFLHGTSIMHRNAAGRSREERVQQVVSGEDSVRDFASYVPVGEVVAKLKSWEEQGAEIIYLSSHVLVEEVEKDKAILRRHDFPNGEVLFRQRGEGYKDVVEKALPDMLIEDDCESIGGESEMTYPQIKAELKSKIKSIVVEEFEGIDHLPVNILGLMDW